MQMRSLKPVVLLAVPLLFAAATAFGGDGVEINVTNDGTEDLIVTVYDVSAGPNTVVLAHVRINGFTTVPVSLSPDGTGRANISWTATNTDSSFRKCGHEENVEVGDASSLMVRADSNCSTST